MSSDNKVKKKRGRKPKKKTESVEPKIPKKRGRKPRGGKIVNKGTNLTQPSVPVETNIILHLKCNTNQLEKKKFSMLNNKYNPKISQPDPFSLSSNQKLTTLPFESINNHDNMQNIATFQKPLTSVRTHNNLDSQTEENSIDIKDIWKKLSNLKYQLHFNCLPDKRSSCFWFTCPFDNPEIYIPYKKLNINF